jgi:CRP-like cAMP-binding protein
MVNAQDIKGFNLFYGLEDKDLEHIAPLCERRRYPANSVIFDPSTGGGEVYMLEGGNDSVQIEIPLHDHEQKLTVHTLRKGEVFGWASLGPPHSRTATARCLEEASLIIFKGKDLMVLLDEDNRMGYQVMKNLSGIISSRLSYTTVVFRHELQRLGKKPALIST